VAVATCKHGHVLEGDNVYRNSRGVIECKQCRAEQQKRWRDKNPDYMHEYRHRGEWRFCPHCGKPLG
jgi:alkyl hydroperoxide reductase subunit AhpF